MDYKFKQQKKARLQLIASSIIQTPAHQAEFSHLYKELGLTQEEVLRAYVNWDLDIDENTNTIYDSVAVRFAMHLHNILPNSWHAERQHLITERLRKISFSTLADVGFGTPQRYVKELILHDRSKQAVLLDVYDSAMSFATALLTYWNVSWENNVQLARHDMNTQQLEGDYDVYLFQDSVEHAKEPTQYLSNIVKRSPAHAMFFLTIPVEKDEPGPAHHIGWHTLQEATRWVESCGLHIDYQKKILLNPHIDIFIDGSRDRAHYFELLLECSKK